MRDRLTSSLAGLGLKESEGAIYLACLRQPVGLRVHEITRASGLKRSTVDLILERLREKGFITVHYEGARRVFCAEPPGKLLFRLQKSAEDFRQIVPHLSQLAGKSLGNRVRFFQRRESIEEIFDDILLTCRMQPAKSREILTVTSGAAFLRALPDHQRQFINRRVALRIPLRWIGPDDKISRKFQATAGAQLRETRCFDGTRFPFAIELNIYGDKTAIITFDKPDMLGVIIENAAIATSLRSLYNLLWEFLPVS